MSIKNISTDENFSERLKRLISKTGIKKSELAKKLGLGPSAISQMLKGDSGASKRTIKDLARIFSVSEDWLEYGAEGLDKSGDEQGDPNEPSFESLSPGEQDLLRRYRSLDERHQQNILEMIAAYEALSEGVTGRKTAVGGSVVPDSRKK